MIKLLKALHFIGIVMLLVGIFLYWQTDVVQQVSGMLVVASLIGVGTLMMSPLPVALVFEWARNQPTSDNPKE
ncbi:hypothetical protein GCM10009347_18960 [Shewanella algicola]|uniref:Uncharacterized protein n=1 Tax=Shewanella algicola TaxID=640633 RepID=A0A9X2CDL3_9GAMM|nr:hypothetical protein [Shewanella algicola]MCL1105551.1 hypothetical protein [Shewanella algicola]GGP52155.1 hypothetical protein GCM10009347_18960 [Shewanella algicola]